MSTEEEFAKLRRLSERLAEEAEKLGLEMRNVSILPLMEPPHLQVVFSIDVDKLGEVDAASVAAVEEQEAFDEQFNDLARQLRTEQHTTEEIEAEEALRRLSQRGHQILGDGEEPTSG